MISYPRAGLLHWLSHLVCVVLIIGACTILPSSKLAWDFHFISFYTDTNCMNTCSFTIHSMNIFVCVLVEFIICFDELEEASSSS